MYYHHPQTIRQHQPNTPKTHHTAVMIFIPKQQIEFTTTNQQPARIVRPTSSFCSISSKKFSFITPSATFWTLYFSLISFNIGQWSKTWLSVWMDVLHSQSRSSRAVPVILPDSIFKSCYPVRYREMHTRWNSNLLLKRGFESEGLTTRYVPNLESTSPAEALILFSNFIVKLETLIIIKRRFLVR